MTGLKRVDQVAKSITPNDFSAPVVREITVDSATQHVVDDLFERLKGIFPAWKQAWPTPTELAAAKDEWLAEFIRSGINSSDQIQHGVRMAAKHRNPFAPPVGTFVAWCFSPEAFCLPSTEKAYRMAMRNTHPAQAGIANWVHPALYHAAVACGYFNLQRLDRKLGLQLFEGKYIEQCKRLAHGETLSPAPIAALPPPVGPRTEAVANSALEQIRKSLGRERSRANG